jgi:thiol-disulfide isomerase/thioredoxin
VVIPGTMLMLLIFNGELIYEMLTSGNSGNCGCFGSLIEMTPLEAMIKNFIAIGLLILFYFVSSKEQLKEERTVLQGYFQTSMLFNVALAGVLFMFMFVPIKAKLKTENGNNVVYVDETDTDLQEVDSMNKPSDTSSLVESPNNKGNIEPKPVKSGFENVFSDINDGKKILCFFAPGCDHCREAAKSLVALNKTMKDFPKIRIIFMDEEAELIPDFFKFAGKEKGYTHTVMDIKQFWGTLGKSKDVPGVVYLWNGNVQAFYQGIDKEQFDAAALKKVLNKSK